MLAVHLWFDVPATCPFRPGPGREPANQACTHKLFQTRSYLSLASSVECSYTTAARVLAWPMRAISSRRFAPALAVSPLPVCRRSWKWIAGNPAAWRSGSQFRCRKLVRRKGVPRAKRYSEAVPFGSRSDLRISSIASKLSSTPFELVSLSVF